MNFITRFFHEFMNPHCPHCMEERLEAKICDSCEVLRTENNRLVRDNEFLRGLLLEDKQEVRPVRAAENLKPIQTSTPFVPTAVRRQMLESESRHQAQLLKDAPKPDLKKPLTPEVIEKELANLDLEYQDASKSTN